METRKSGFNELTQKKVFLGFSPFAPEQNCSVHYSTQITTSMLRSLQVGATERPLPCRIAFFDFVNSSSEGIAYLKLSGDSLMELWRRRVWMPATFAVLA